MSKINDAIKDFRSIDNAARENPLNRSDPLIKLLMTLAFLIVLMSRSRYDLAGVIITAVYPAVSFGVVGLSFRLAVRRLRIVLPLVALMGVLEPFFNRGTVMITESFAVRAGVITGLTLILKGVLAVFGAYILMASTPIEDICAALRRVHVPAIIVTVILLIYRYIGVLLSEGRRVVQAYELRAPGQKGVAFAAWGSLLGGLLLRSMDRADDLYQSMLLRGYGREDE